MVGISRFDEIGSVGRLRNLSLQEWAGSLFGTILEGSSWLTVTAGLMVVDTFISLAGLVLDPTLITGAPAWMKPLKFALSVLLFSPTVAWMIGKLRRARRLGKFLGGMLSVSLLAEIVLIDLQAARHTTSHFNMATHFDAGVFQAMGIFIAILFTCTGILLVATCFERFGDRNLGWTIRLGLLFAFAGMSTGVLMTLPTPEQMAASRATGSMPHAGAHTVGGPDGGASMPVTGWSADHGDLRIAHFLGLHAMQVLVLAWWLLRGKERRQAGAIRLVAVLSALAFGITLWQALRGQPLLNPGTTTLGAWAGWAAIAVVGAIWIRFAGANIRREEAL